MRPVIHACHRLGRGRDWDRAGSMIHLWGVHVIGGHVRIAAPLACAWGGGGMHAARWRHPGQHLQWHGTPDAHIRIVMAPLGSCPLMTCPHVWTSHVPHNSTGIVTLRQCLCLADSSARLQSSSSGARFRSWDLWVMGPTRWPLRHSADKTERIFSIDQ